MPCTFFIKQSVGERTIIWSLNPSVTFGNPRNEVKTIKLYKYTFYRNKHIILSFLKFKIYIVVYIFDFN